MMNETPLPHIYGPPSYPYYCVSKNVHSPVTHYSGSQSTSADSQHVHISKRWPKGLADVLLLLDSSKENQRSPDSLRQDEDWK